MRSFLAARPRVVRLSSRPARAVSRHTMRPPACRASTILKGPGIHVALEIITYDRRMVETLSPELYDQVEEAMKDVVDPEIGINVVDLGLVYDFGWDSENAALVLQMTLTSAECPLQDEIVAQTAEALDGIVESFRINWVWMPAWGPDKVTDDGRDMMRALGFNI